MVAELEGQGASVACPSSPQQRGADYRGIILHRGWKQYGAVRGLVTEGWAGFHEEYHIVRAKLPYCGRRTADFKRDRTAVAS